MHKRVDFKNLQSVESFLLDMLSQYVELTSVTLEPRSSEVFLYDRAVSSYREGSSEESLGLFAKLVLMEPLSFDYWMGMASSLHQSKNYIKALSCYAIVALLDAEDPSPHFHAAQIFLQQGNELEFSKAVELAYARATLNATYTPWLEKIMDLKDLFYRKGKRVYAG
ncbi:MAG: tetratricopeptide repeat protein [Chlamydiota bacterium]